MEINQSEAAGRFAAYVKEYDVNDEKVRLKIEHTYKVAALCREIAKSEKLPPGDVDLAWLIGLLHDIGRFEQLRRFGTFMDACSIDHASFGADLLFKGGLIREFIADQTWDTTIEHAIRTHSMYRLPSEFDDRTLLFCNIIRDADKVDIMRVNVETPLEEIYNVTTDELRRDDISEKVLESFFEEHATLHAYCRKAMDFLAAHISLVYELVFPYSVYEAYRQGFLYQMMNFQSENPHTQQQFQVIRERVGLYMDKCIQKCQGMDKNIL